MRYFAMSYSEYKKLDVVTGFNLLKILKKDMMQDRGFQLSIHGFDPMKDQEYGNYVREQRREYKKWRSQQKK